MREPTLRTVAMLMTDVVGSTTLWRTQPQIADQALRAHDKLIQAAATEFMGNAPRNRTEGDGAFIVFPTVALACSAALKLQLGLAEIGRLLGQTLEMRCAIHIGETRERDQDWYGSPVNRCARIRSIANGGQILLSEMAALHVQDSAAIGFGLKELGRMRLKDFPQPELIFQLTHPDLRSSFPAPSVLDRAETNLPSDLARFLGREGDLSTLDRLLRDRRQVTLLGAGGVGKTRLAVQLASRLQEGADPAVFVDLTLAASPAEVPPVFQTALGLEPSNDLTPLWKALSNRRPLLVVDNCEHLVEAAGAICGEILRRSSTTQLLATSRQPLGFPGEQTYRVSGLCVPSPDATDPEVVAQSEAVSLLVDRCRLRTPDFAVDQENAPWLARIVARLEGLPLPIELAAARLHIMSPRELDNRLSDFFRALGAAPAGAVARHRTIDSTIDWSYGLLTADECSLFLALSLLPGGWTAESAEEIASNLDLNSEPLDLLAHLVDKSMAVAGLQSPSSRMKMLAPIREFGMRRLGSQWSAQRSAVLSWAADRCETEMQGEHRRGTLGDEDFANNAAALDIGLKEHKFAESLSIVKRTFRTWMAKGLLEDGRRKLETLLTFVDYSQPDHAGFAFNIHGILTWAQKDLDTAEASLRKAIECWQELSQSSHISLARQNLGLVMASREQWAEAQEQIQLACDGFEAAKELRNVALAKTNLANLFLEQGDLPNARGRLEESLKIANQASDALVAQTAHGLLARIALDLGDLERSRFHLQEALRGAVALNDELGAAQALVTAARLALRDRVFDRATQIFGTVRTTFEHATYKPTPRAYAELDELENALHRSFESSEEYDFNFRLGASKGALKWATSPVS